MSMTTWSKAKLSGKPSWGGAPGGLNAPSKNGDSKRLGTYARRHVTAIDELQHKLDSLAHRFPDGIPPHVLTRKEKETMEQIQHRSEWEKIALACESFAAQVEQGTLFEA